MKKIVLSFALLMAFAASFSVFAADAADQNSTATDTTAVAVAADENVTATDTKAVDKDKKAAKKAKKAKAKKTKKTKEAAAEDNAKTTEEAK